MTELILAALVFLGIHGLSSTPLRGGVVGLVGENGFRAGFSILSLAAIIWLVRAYNHAPAGDVIWLFGAWARGVAFVLVFLAMVLVVCGLTVKNPTAAGFEGALEDANPARGILRVTRHPFLWGVTLWSVAHVLNNGNVAAVIFFATFGVLAFGGTFLVDAKKRRAYGAAWESFAAVTSNLPGRAIAAGRNRLRLSEIGAWRLVLAVALFVVLLHFHANLFGVSPLA